MNSKPALKHITIDDIREDIQRAEGMKQQQVRGIADAFDPSALSTITVSQRPNGDLFVLDGRHRCAAARLAKYDGLMPATVITGLSREREAELFILLNESQNVSALSKFLAAVVAGWPAEVEMNEIVERYNWTVSPDSSPGNLAAVTALERVYHKGASAANTKGPHPELLDRVMCTITEAWEYERKSADSHVLLGVAQLYARFGEQVDDVKLISQLQDTRPGVLIGQAKALRDVQGGTVPAALAKVLVGIHNKRRRTNLLPEWVWTR